MKLTRQHAQTSLQELQGERCKSLLVVKDLDSAEIIVFFIETESLFLRGFLDEGLLFLSSFDREYLLEEFEESDQIVYLEDEYSIFGQKISSAKMGDGAFKIKFANNILFLFYEDSESTFFKASLSA